MDPRAAEIVAFDRALPAVGPERLEPAALRRRFADPPVWRPDSLSDRGRSAEGATRAAVLMPIVAHPQGATLLLTQRTVQLRRHSGQVAFPGGRHDPGDASIVATALREAHEEVGLPAERVEIIGQMPEYITGTGFRVTPVVALLEPGFVPVPDPAEVADVFEVPLQFLMNPHHHQRRRILSAEGERHFLAMPWRAPGTDTEYFIWGATAAMVRNLYRLLSA